MNNRINNRLHIKELLKRLNNPYEVHKFTYEINKETNNDNYVFSSCGFWFTRKEINIFHGNLLNIKLIRYAVDCIPNKK